MNVFNEGWNMYPEPTISPTDWETRTLRESLIQLLAPLASAAGVTTVENIINTAAKLERYIVTGHNPLEPVVIDHDGSPILSDSFELDATGDDSIYVDEDGILQN